MKRDLHSLEVLEYYDGVQLFVGADQLGVRYICMLVERHDESDRYLCAPVSSQRLAAFRRGDIDLRDLFTSPETDELYCVAVTGTWSEDHELATVEPSQVTEDWLPEPGYLYEEGPQPAEAVQAIVEESQTRNRPVIHLRLAGTTSPDDSSIRTGHLADVLVAYQALIKQAYFKAMQETKGAAKQVVDAVNHAFSTNTFAFSPGSFTVHLESAVPGNLLGYTDIVKALEKIDEITNSLGDTQQAIEVMQANKGRLARAYLRLLQLVVVYDLPVSYQWIEPQLEKPVTGAISKTRATELYEILSKREDLGVEDIELLGRFTKVDVVRRSWTLSSEMDHRSYNGLVREGLSLSGITIESQAYKLVCEEIAGEIVGTGEEKSTLYLRSYHVL